MIAPPFDSQGFDFGFRAENSCESSFRPIAKTNRSQPMSPQVAWDWLRSRHSDNHALIALVLGVSNDTVAHWAATGSVTHPYPLLIDQMANGPAVRLALWRGECAIRPEWRELLRCVLVDARAEIEALRKAEERVWRKAYRKNQRLRLQRRLKREMHK